MCYFRRHNQSVRADERFAGCADSFLAVRGEGELGGAGVAAVKGPFRFAVADDEDAGGGHCGGVTRRGPQGEWEIFGERLGGGGLFRERSMLYFKAYWLGQKQVCLSK